MGMKFIEQAISEPITGDTCCFTGRVSHTRRHGKVAFLDVIDDTGKVQVVIEKGKCGTSFKQASHVSPGSYVAVKGKFVNNGNGGYEINADSLEIIAPP